MKQTEFEGALGKTLRDDGMARAARSAGHGWREAAESTVAFLAGKGEEFTSDQVWAMLGKEMQGDPRALGAVMVKMARLGIIRRTGTRQTRQASRHAGMVTVWIGT